MKFRAWIWAAIFSGVGVLLVPLFLPPDPIYPSVFSFLPYAVLFAASLIIKSKSESTVLLVVALAAVFIGSFVYLDTLRFNILFSWQISGLVTSFIPWFQLAACLPVAIWLSIRKRGNNRIADEPSC